MLPRHVLKELAQARCHARAKRVPETAQQHLEQRAGRRKASRLLAVLSALGAPFRM